MTVASELAEIEYAGDGSTVAFAIPFGFSANADIAVSTRDSTGDATPLSTGFTITGAGTGSGTCTFTTAPANGTTVRLERAPEIVQNTDYTANDAFPAEATESALDERTYVDQFLRALIKRCIQVPAGDAAIDDSVVLPSVTNRKGKLLYFDATTGAVDVLDLTDVSGISSPISQGLLGATLYPRTAAEIAASVTPSAYYYAPGNIERYGADRTGAVNSKTAIQNACDQAAQAGGAKPFATGGTYLLSGSSKLVIKSDCDFSAAIFNIEDAPAIAVEISTGSAANPTDYIWNLDCKLPALVNLDKPGAGWAGQGTGLRLVNVQNSRIALKRIQEFSVGLHLSAYSQGCAYNSIHVENQYNNKINILLSAGNASGYVNENTFYSGACAHVSGEGTNIASVRHVLIECYSGGNIPNNNRFRDISLEGDGPEYHVEEQGIYNHFHGCRWEATAPKVYYNATATGGAIEGSTIEGGYGLTAIATTFAGIVAVKVGGIARRNGQCFADQGFSWSNVSGDDKPVLRVFDSAATEPWEKSASATDWMWQLTGRDLTGKPSANAEASFTTKLDALNGRVYINNGIFWSSGAGSPEGVITAPIGSLYSNTSGGASTTLYVKTSGTGSTGWTAK